MPQVGTVDRFADAIDVVAAIGREESVIAMEKQAKVDFADGVQQVSQGASLAQIEQDQPWYNNVFGPSASLAGAEAFTAQRGISEQATKDALFLDTDEGRSMNPATYRTRQGDTLKSMLTGNQRVDTLITAEYVPKMAALADAQVKANRAYVNEQNIINMGDNILSQANGLNALTKTGGWSGQLVEDAKIDLATTLKNKPPEMDDATYRKLLAQSVLTNYAQGSDVMDLMTREMGTKFTPSEAMRIANAKSAFLADNKAGIDLKADASYGEIAAGVDAGTVTTAAELTELLATHSGEFGDLTQRSTRSLFRKLANVQAKEQVLTVNSDKVFTGNIHQIPEKKDRQAAYQHAKKRIRSHHGTDEEGTAAANADIVRLWQRNGAGIKDEQLAAQFGHMQTGFSPDGKVDPNYINTFETFKDYYQADPDRALDHMSNDSSKLRAKGMMMLIDDGLAEGPEDALRILQTQYTHEVDKAYISSREFNTTLTDLVEDVTSSKWSWGIFEGREEQQGKAVASQWIRTKAKQLALIGGSVDQAVETAAAMYNEGFDVIQGIPIHRDAGIALKTRMGLYEGTGSAEDAITGALASGWQGDRAMQPGEYKILSSFKDSLLVQVDDPEGGPFAIATREYSLKEIGLHSNTKYNLEFTAEAIIADKIQIAVTNHSGNVKALRKLRESQGFPVDDMTDEQLTKELEQNTDLNMSAQRFLETQL